MKHQGIWADRTHASDNSVTISESQRGAAQPARMASVRAFTRRVPSQLMPGEAAEIVAAVEQGRSVYQTAQAHNCSEALVLALWIGRLRLELRRAA